MKQFLLATSRVWYSRLLMPALLIGVLTSLPGCTSSTLQSIQIIPNGGATLGNVGDTVQFKAIAVYTHGRHPSTTADITTQVAWSSSLVEVATVNATGMATAVAPGLATITAQGSGNLGVVTATTSVTVTSSTSAPPALRDLTSIAISPATQTIVGVGVSAQFVAIGTFSSAPLSEDITASAVWSSTEASVASVSSMGVAKGLSAGTSTITASAKNTEGALITTTATATVTTSTTMAPGLVSVAIIPGTQTVSSPGEASQFIAIGTYINSSAVTQDMTSQVHWISSDVSVATINAQGLATGVGTGTTAITALITGAGGAVVTGTATFTEATGATPTGNVATLGVYKVGNGTGTVTATYSNPQGGATTILTCGSGSQCVGSVPIGSLVTLVGAPDGTFGGWSANCAPVYMMPLSSTPVPIQPPTCTVDMTTNQTVVAIFY